MEIKLHTTATNFKIQTYGYHKRNKREIREDALKETDCSYLAQTFIKVKHQEL